MLCMFSSLVFGSVSSVDRIREDIVSCERVYRETYSWEDKEILEDLYELLRKVEARLKEIW